MRSVASRDDLAEEIAYLRGNYGLYEALDAQFYNGKVSGIGIGRWFTRDQLQEGVRRLRIENEEAVEPAVRFLQTCLDRMPVDHRVIYMDFG